MNQATIDRPATPADPLEQRMSSLEQRSRMLEGVVQVALAVLATGLRDVDTQASSDGGAHDVDRQYHDALDQIRALLLGRGVCSEGDEVDELDRLVGLRLDALAKSATLPSDTALVPGRDKRGQTATK